MAWDRLDPEALTRLSGARPPLLGRALSRPLIMGVVNVTPDSFSDGGRFYGTDLAVAQGRALAEAGADLLDVGGESTRPGAEPVSPAQEAARVLPVILGLRAAVPEVPISIDTRNATVAAAALEAGAAMINDVSALTHDADMAPLAASTGVPLCLMHAQGDPRTMQDDPRYGDVLAEVCDWLAGRVALAESFGIARSALLIDPGIGFGKNVQHNLALIRGVSALHDLGLPVLLGVSRKRFIGAIGKEARADGRVPGSLAAGLAGLSQGVHILRVHDVAETVQARALWAAIQDAGAGSGADKPRLSGGRQV
ncbi:MAG: dihydropteroate synthase [Rhodobacteraceae bacterium]|nr:dihydropteroate synthase [Paracoccaceae bacterium]